MTLPPGGEGHFSLILVWDLPLIEFGSGRTWEKTYTAHYGADGRQSQRIAEDAFARHDAWRQSRDAWHQRILGSGGIAEQRRRGACINDLAYVISGGTAWVSKQHSAAELEPPLLGDGEHFAILEGYENGYHFYNTFDLWPHAQAAFEANWPRLSELLLADYLRTLPLALEDQRLILGTGLRACRKVAFKVPHDLGAPPGDPWHILNEYNANRDSNVWKDHNPAFLLSLYLHRKHNGDPVPGDSEWSDLVQTADFMLAQDKDGDGLPDHDTQGDSTWDALRFTGPSPYSESLTLDALAAMVDWSRRRGDMQQENRFSERLATAWGSFERHFWNGRYYRAAANGDQAEWIFADGLFGVLLAEAAGLPELLPRDHIVAHLRAVAQRNWRGLAKGAIGPALFAPLTGEIPSGVQVGEVLVGSARSAIALTLRHGLNVEANGMMDALNDTIYRRSGLQFRTPAAITAQGTFRAPSNLRPLTSWYFVWPDSLLQF